MSDTKGTFNLVDNKTSVGKLSPTEQKGRKIRIKTLSGCDSARRQAQPN